MTKNMFDLDVVVEINKDFETENFTRGAFCEDPGIDPSALYRTRRMNDNGDCLDCP